MMYILGLQPATLTRYDAGTRDATGRFVPGASVTIPFTGSFQPFPSARLATLSEGERQMGQLEVWTRQELRTADQHTSTPADLVTYGGVVYEVREVEAWPVLLAHYQARLMRVQEQEVTAP